MTDRIHESRNIALLIDADNASPANIDAALTILGDLGTVNVRRIYGNWSKPALKGWAQLIHRYALEPRQQFDLTKGKNATDMKMTIDAMDLLYGGRVEGFGIMSSDSDFMPLAMRIRQNGTPVYGFGAPRTPEGFREACTRFIDIDAVVAQGRAEEVAAQNPASPEEPTRVAPPEGEVDEQLVKLMSDAWKASKRDEKGFAALSEVGNRFSNLSSADVRSFGKSRFSDLVKTLPMFTLERRENLWFVKRTR